MTKWFLIAILASLNLVGSRAWGQESPRQPPPTGKPADPSRTQSPGITFGKRAKEEILENPYRFHTTPNILVDAVKGIIHDQEIEIDPEPSRPREGVIVTKPYVFAKGITAVSELQRVSNPPAEEAHNWDSARYSLDIRITLAEANLTLVSVTALIEGRAQGVSSSKWFKAESKGVFENDFLIALRNKVEIK